MSFADRVFRLEEVHFYSLSGSKVARTTHPAATLPSLVIFPPCDIEPTTYIHIYKLCVAGDLAIWEINVQKRAVIHACNWKTGQIIKVCISFSPAGGRHHSS